MGTYPLRPESPQPRDFFKIISKSTSRTEDPMTSKMTARPPKTPTKSCKIETWNLRILFLVFFSRSLFLDDSTRNLKVFQVLGAPRKTITAVASDNHIGTMYRQNSVQSSISNKK